MKLTCIFIDHGLLLQGEAEQVVEVFRHHYNIPLVEPLRELFKDEVRVLGRELGLPESLVGRHSFLGHGLAIRIPGFVSREKADILRKAASIYLAFIA